MSAGAALRVSVDHCDESDLMPALLVRAADAAGGLIDGRLLNLASEDARQLAGAYEAALLVNFTPSEVAMLRRLLLRVEASARRLSGQA